MTELHYRSRFLGLRRILRGLVTLEVLASVGLIVVLVTRRHITVFVGIATAVAALIIVFLALALRMGFRNLPEVERMSAKFDEEAAEQKGDKLGAHSE